MTWGANNGLAGCLALSSGFPKLVRPDNHCNHAALTRVATVSLHLKSFNNP